MATISNKQKKKLTYMQQGRAAYLFTGKQSRIEGRQNCAQRDTAICSADKLPQKLSNNN